MNKQLVLVWSLLGVLFLVIVAAAVSPFHTYTEYGKNIFGLDNAPDPNLGASVSLSNLNPTSNSQKKITPTPPSLINPPVSILPGDGGPPITGEPNDLGIHDASSNLHYTDSQTHTLNTEDHSTDSWTHLVSTTDHLATTDTHGADSKTHLTNTSNHFANSADNHDAISNTHSVGSDTHDSYSSDHSANTDTHLSESNTHLLATHFHLNDSRLHDSYSDQHSANSKDHSAESYEHYSESLTHAVNTIFHEVSSDTFGVPDPALIPVVSTQAQNIAEDSSVIDLDLSQGSSGDEVKALQSKLAAQGLFAEEITGYFGPKTLEAVKAFQTKNNVSPVSGFVGPLTRTALNAGN